MDVCGWTMCLCGGREDFLVKRWPSEKSLGTTAIKEMTLSVITKSVTWIAFTHLKNNIYCWVGFSK